MFVFRPVTEADLPLLLRWLAEPHVRRWWGEPEVEAEEIRGHFSDPLVNPYLVLLDGEPIGYIQSYVVDGPEHPYGDQPAGTVGIDQFIGPRSHIGRGLGPQMIEAFVAGLFEQGVERIIIDPHPDNRPAIRAYEKAGFRVFDQRQTEDGPALMMARDRARRRERDD
ncbi:GNAT family N-acetyltransferase [Mycoplana dimorpha]|uniref:Aminoglycoside 6'-N-acetyltransferase n=1 Tax=Mycoplana dimorpha TaxID=28320 RepID=A0A2T5BAK4_MYCDI|nr:GNAT family N-acetyltransferase [Mycoplana dimorpha]PTM95999.1 aminoglycoside 6'-N-acetyltransferase [Mycoplana dimorpha]